MAGGHVDVFGQAGHGGSVLYVLPINLAGEASQPRRTMMRDRLAPHF